MWLVPAALVAALSLNPVPEVLSPLQGTWKLRSVERGGKALELDGMATTVTIKGDKMILWFEGNQSKTYRIEMGPKGGAKHIDLYDTIRISVGWQDGRMIREEYRGKFLESVGVYSVEGKTLKMCLVMSTDTEKRPDALTTKGQPDRDLVTLVREK